MSHAVGTLAPLRHRSFAVYFWARAFSSLGTAMAVPALVFALAERNAGNGIAEQFSGVGLALAGRQSGQILLTLLGGVVADRYSPLRILAVTNSVNGLLQTALGALLVAGSPPMVLVVSWQWLAGAVTALSVPAAQGLLTGLVPKPEMRQAQALRTLSTNVVTVIGPALCGVAVAWIRPGWIMVVDGVTWFVAGLVFTRIRTAGPGRNVTRRAILAKGLKLYASSRWLVLGTGALMVVQVAREGVWLVLGPPIALHTPSIGARGWGFALSAQAVGAVAMGVLIARLKFERPLFVPMLAGAAMGLPLAFFPLIEDWRTLALTSLLAGAGLNISTTYFFAAIYESVDGNFIGRVMSIYATAIALFVPVVQVIIPFVASDRSSGQCSVALAGAALMLATAGYAATMATTRTVQSVELEEPELAPQRARTGQA
ncbi:MFS transporter [Streptomyces sp. NPDC046985]|uniref:MFS transporter n=1 Tax=Streptomyces sp. NPDC046985 TaxID=3155377 RepID=UPI0033DC9239